MNIGDLISANTVIELKNTDKSRVLAELSRLSAAVLDIDPQAVLQSLVRREDLGSTGIGNGIAIPHAGLGQIGRAFGALARLRPAIEFGAIDDRPVDLVFLLLLPDQIPEARLKPMACVARRLRDPALVAMLRAANGPSSIYKVLIEA